MATEDGTHVIREPRAPPTDGSMTFSPRSAGFNPPPAPVRRRRLPMATLPPGLDSDDIFHNFRAPRPPQDEPSSPSSTSSDENAQRSADVIRRFASFSRRTALPDHQIRRNSRAPTNLEQFLRRLNDEELANDFQTWMLESEEQPRFRPAENPPPAPPMPRPPLRKVVYDFLRKSLCLIGTLVVGVVFVLFGVVFAANSVVLEYGIKNAYVIAGTVLVSVGACIMSLYTAWHCYHKVIKKRLARRAEARQQRARTDSISEWSSQVHPPDLISCTFASGEPPVIDFDPVVELYSHRGSSVWMGSSFSTLPPPYSDLMTTLGNTDGEHSMTPSNLLNYSDVVSLQLVQESASRSRSSSFARWRQRAATETKIHRNRIIHQSRRSLTTSSRGRLDYKRLNI